jgi:signal transduction histidine kinase
MLVGADLGTKWGMQWILAGAVATLAALAWRMRRRNRLLAAERSRERRVREELEAYARLDPSLTQRHGGSADALEAARLLARRVCGTIAEKSVFNRVTLLLRNAEGRFACLGSVGTDDLTTAALHAWGESVVQEERGGRKLSAEVRTAGKSFSIPLGEWGSFDREVGSWAASGRKERRRWRRANLVPIRTGANSGGHGRLVGAIAVCADGRGVDGEGGAMQAMGPIEALAERLAAALENQALTERLLRAEKLAGLGQLAGGVAHALNNPLTAVLGFSELIAETASEPRVRKDAETILLEARKMRETVQRLIDFWRPATPADEPVDVTAILRELAGACAATLKERGVLLEIAEDADAMPVRGSRDRLRQVFEHLLNNAAQAIAKARLREPGESLHAIRVTVSHDDDALHVIVSDTGPGFTEPGRVFDPFYTTKGPEQGAGMGLSICYGIVREHGGEISAFNLHPHGAAVVVELPVRIVVASETAVVKQTEQSKA